MKIIKFLFSGAFMGILLIVFAYAIGYATFVENDYGPVAAKLLVYNARWFEVLLFLMVVNFTGMIFTKHLYLKGKLNILLIHLALIIIILGAGITRYFGYEGMMHIRNGESTNILTSTDSFLQVQVGSGEEKQQLVKKVMLTPVRNELTNTSTVWQQKQIDISVQDYYQKATRSLITDPDGESYLVIQLRTMTENGEIYLKQGESEQFQGVKFTFSNNVAEGSIGFDLIDGQLYIKNGFSTDELAEMDTARMGRDGFIEIEKLEVRMVGGVAFRVADIVENGKIQYKPAENQDGPGVPIVKVVVNDKSLYTPTNSTVNFDIDGVPVKLRVGIRNYQLPFELRLDKFELERYPGSNSPSSFASEVTVIDNQANKQFPYRIFMNNVLDYGGFRFFQSSYDADEQGTILSVNHDYWGTLVTYIGYFLLFVTLLVSFFTKTRFMRINLMLKDVHAKRKVLLSKSVATGFLLLFSTIAIAQPQVADKDHATEFGKLFVQNNAGRIEPVNTLSTKVLVKISKKSSFKGLSADQVLLAIVTNPQEWQEVPIIKVGEAEIRNILKVSGDYAAFKDFIGEEGQYKLNRLVETAYQKKPALRSTLDKGLINVDERVNVFYSIVNGELLRIFPLENDDNYTWVGPRQLHEHYGHGTEKGDLFEKYTMAIADGIERGDYTLAREHLEAIKQLQLTEGADVVPSPTKAKIEILYNKTNIFKTLFPVYLVLGAILVGIFLIQIFYPNREFRVLAKILFVLMAISFVLQTSGLAARWYISGHAPWSNGYESMIYISWATILAGFLFRNRSGAVLGVTAMLAGITLLTAHMSWLNPELTNLVPVLKSYWLTFHVATITASYGFLGLGCLIGLLNLCIMIFRNKKNMEMVNLTLKELMLITEMSLAVGLVLLVIGNFLGGIWANESWGRYWGWDPKETWTLVTVILYTFTLHLVLIPSLRNTFTFSFFSFISFGAVLMTYFGVNYYLSGLHSYANGDPIAIPNGLYYALGVIAIISLLAAYNEFKFRKETEDNSAAPV